MSITIIKLIAAFSMLLDHISEAFGFNGWNFFDGFILSEIGRISFPLFVFAAVNGWHHTANKQNYINRIAVFAAISQIPYSLIFSITNLMPLQEGEKLFYIGCNYKITIFVFVTAVLLFHFYIMLKNDILQKQHILLFLLFLFYSIKLKINGIWILNDDLNVLNTFLCGFLLIFHYEEIKKNGLKKEGIACVTYSAIFVFFCAFRADYGQYYAGIVFLLLLYVTYHKKILNCIIITVWGFLLYAVVYHNFKNAVFTMLSVLFVLLHDENKKPYFKKFFYVFYPLHILIIGIVSIIIKLQLI